MKKLVAAAAAVGALANLAIVKEMHLLSLTLQRPSAIQAAIYGNFSAPKTTELVVARGSILELLRPDDTGKTISICSTNLFAVVRSLMPFRLQGANRDYIVVGSDSGKIAIVDFCAETNSFRTVHCETFGKTGCRRIVPGQYLACDPRGRAIMIGALEKQKFVYVMHRDNANRLTISSPLEAHKSEAVVFSICGVDNGFENPIFAIIELDYSEADKDASGLAAQEAEKNLTYYELDLGLNHVMRKWSEPISRTANFLLTVPGGPDGPSGVLVCGENWVAYKHQGHPEIRTPIPRRQGMPPDRGLLVTAGVMHKQKDMFFFILQSEMGDLYKVTLDVADEGKVRNVKVTVFDTVQVASSLCITRTGLLFVASEFGNHSLYQFQSMGDDDNAVAADSVGDELNQQLGDDAESAAQIAPIFTPSSTLINLLRVDDMDSLAAITDMLVDNLRHEETPQIYTLCGQGERSSLRILRHGVSVSALAVSPLPHKPSAIWTVKERCDGEVDRFIVVSFSSTTMVLSVGAVVEEVTDSGFVADARTLEVGLMRDNSIVQVHSTGIRHIRPNKRISEWKAPGKRQLEKASVNETQVAISMSGGDLVYFELDAGGNLVEEATKEMGREVSCLDVGEVPAGRAKSMFLVVGSWDNTVQVLSLDRSDFLAPRATKQLNSRPDSCCLVEMAMDDRGGVGADTAQMLYLNIGLNNGVLERAAVDPVVGTLSDTRQRFLGNRSVKLFRVRLQGRRAVLALSARAWLLYNYQGKYLQAPLSYEALEYAASFSSDMCAEGFAAVANQELHILTTENLGGVFNQETVPLRYTPRRLVRIPGQNQLAIIESDHNAYNESEKHALGHPTSSELQNGQAEEQDEAVKTTIRGPMPPADGKWASCLRILDAPTGQTLELLEFGENEAAVSLTTCRFASRGQEQFIIVGTAKDMTHHPRSAQACYLHVYRIVDNRLVLLHKTECDDVPYCLHEFNGRLLVGVGRALRMYELGKKKLLRKAENRQFPTFIVRIHSQGDRIYVADAMESMHFVKYKRHENSFVIFADDTTPRFVTASTLLDYDTVAGGDKFGNVWVLRLPSSVSDDVDNPTGSRILWDQGLLNGAPSKLELLTHYYVGETITSFVKTSLVPGGRTFMLVGTVTGAIYVFLPFESKEDWDFYQQLEMFLRQENLSIAQRDCLSYRSSFLPLKDTVDGDLCEMYGTLQYSKQKEIADDLERTPGEIIKKLEDTRNALL